MALPGGVDYVRKDGETYEAKRRRELRETAASAKKAGEDWGRRWHLSLAVGNAAALAAISSATLTIAVNHPANGFATLGWALIPSAWFFAVGLICGAVLPYCWKKKVETIGDWVDVNLDELEENGPVQYPSGEDDFVYSNDLLARYEKHQKRWSKILDRCELVAVGGFLAGLVWLLLFFSLRATH